MEDGTPLAPEPAPVRSMVPLIESPSVTVMVKPFCNASVPFEVGAARAVMLSLLAPPSAPIPMTSEVPSSVTV